MPIRYLSLLPSRRRAAERGRSPSLHGLTSPAQSLRPSVMQDGVSPPHARIPVSVSNKLEAQKAQPAAPRAPSSKGKGAVGDGVEAGSPKIKDSEWKKKHAPSVRVPQSPDNANKDLWAQVCHITTVYYLLYC